MDHDQHHPDPAPVADPSGSHDMGDMGGMHGGLTESPSASTLLEWMAPEPWVAALLIVLSVGYGAGLLTLRGQGIAWPWYRTLAWAAGVASLALMTATGIAGYGMVLFSVHMGQHMMLSMVTPVLLLAGAPVTLLLRALPRRSPGRRAWHYLPRTALLHVLHSKILAVATHPLVGSALFVGSLYGLYFTPLLNNAMSSQLGHALMLCHFVLVGLVFFGPVLAVDPWPHRSPAGVRLFQVILAVPFHAFFAIAVMQASMPLSTVFASSTRSLGMDPIQDQYVGGSIAWVFGEVPIILIGLILFVQWVRDDARQSRRLDRQAERDGDARLLAYNAALGRLGDRDRP